MCNFLPIIIIKKKKCKTDDLRAIITRTLFIVNWQIAKWVGFFYIYTIKRWGFNKKSLRFPWKCCKIEYIINWSTTHFVLLIIVLYFILLCLKIMDVATILMLNFQIYHSSSKSQWLVYCTYSKFSRFPIIAKWITNKKNNYLLLNSLAIK